jgi:hypothetical protein
MGFPPLKSAKAEEMKKRVDARRIDIRVSGKVKSSIE